MDYQSLVEQIKDWSHELGFQAVGISDTNLDEAERHLLNWLKHDRHGEMEYMQKHGSKRSRPAELHANTIRIISVRMDYFPESNENPAKVLDNKELAYVSRYALGRDYHKVLRNRLQKLAKKIEDAIGPFGYRVFVDSAPVLEKAIAEKAGLGWIGKHSNLLSRDAGSWFFLGEMYVDIPLPLSQAVSSHCGDCQACIVACPTDAIIAPYEVDARRCISYLTIEYKGSIPVEFRKAMGNRIYGCDDCQLVCPWNRFSKASSEPDFKARHHLDTATLLSLFAWDEATFLKNTEGSAIRRIGYISWMRNIAVALGNAPTSPQIIQALQTKMSKINTLVDEHIQWALQQHVNKHNH